MSKREKRVFLSPPWMGGSERDLIDEVFLSNYIAPCGPMVDRFEREFAGTVGLPFACALSSCSAALDLLFHELGVSVGDSVFCSDLTFVASIAPAIHRGATPVFIDADDASWTMDAGLLEEALTEAGKKGRLPKAVVAVDLYGQCCDYDAIAGVCERFGVPLIIDAAEALGARYYGRGSFVHYSDSAVVGKAETGNSNLETRDSVSQTNELMNLRSDELPACVRHAGDAGWAAVYSFNGNKIITTSGGGMLASRDEGIVERARSRSQQSRRPTVWYEHEELGYNYRMSNVVAGIGVGQLQCLDEILERKRRVFERYGQRLGAGGSFRFMPEAAYGRCTRWLTVVELGEDEGRRTEDSGTPSALSERVRLALEAENIESRPVWKPMHLQPVFRGAKIFGGAVAMRVFEKGLCLPSGAGLTESEIDHVTETVLRAMGLKPSC